MNKDKLTQLKAVLENQIEDGAILLAKFNTHDMGIIPATIQITNLDSLKRDLMIIDILLES